MKKTPRKRRNQAGFSIVEAMFASIILGIGLMGLVKLHVSSMRGVARAGDTSEALHVAEQLAEMVSARQLGSSGAVVAPTCGPDEGCRNGGTGSTVYTSPKAVDSTLGEPCTMYFDEPPVPDASGAFVQVPAANARFRMDRALVAHTGANHPNAQLMRVWVCWRDTTGAIQEYETSKLLVPGL